MTTDEQIKLWVEGESVHIEGENGGMCCPDFSCCQPEFLAPKEERELFAELYLAGKESEYIGMLGLFLNRAFGHLAKIHVIRG